MAVNTFKLEFDDGVTQSLEVVIVSPTDIVMFVAGTQDPINTMGLNHQANKSYWQNSKENFWETIKNLKPQFHDLHLGGGFFSWSGDNSTKKRNEAADRLLQNIIDVYPKFKNKETHLHLIGHSHGGNVINQFTELITADTRFPKLWKIKSITYLSTPFFKEKHQLNHTKIHKDCKIINVHNDYDITQRFIADFSLENLESLISGFDSFEFYKATKRINLIMSSGVFAPVTSKSSIISDATEGPLIWERVSLLLDNISDILAVFIKSITNLKIKKLATEQKEILGHLNVLQAWVPTAQTNLNNRVTTYQERRANIEQSSDKDGLWDRFKDNVGKTADSVADGLSDTFEATDLMSDLNMLVPLKTINTILFIDKGLEDAYLLGLSERIFAEQSGVTDSIDNTSWHPKEQVKEKFEIIDVPITDKDKFHSRGQKQNFEKFVSGAENSIENGNLKEFLIRLVSQLISSETIDDKSTALWWADLLFSNEADTEFKKLRRKYLPKYSALISQYEANLIAPKDVPTKKEDKTVTPDAFTEAARLQFTTDLELINSINKEAWKKIVKAEKEKNKEKEKNNPPAPPVIGSLDHFATISHGLSHTQLWEKVEKGLRNSFSSGKNPGYKG